MNERHSKEEDLELVNKNDAIVFHKTTFGALVVAVIGAEFFINLLADDSLHDEYPVRLAVAACIFWAQRPYFAKKANGEKTAIVMQVVAILILCSLAYPEFV